MTQHYGQTDAEKLADEKTVCRQIVSEVSNFGLSQRQLLFVVYLLSMELEDVHKMQELSAVIRELGGADVFITDRSDQPEPLVTA